MQLSRNSGMWICILSPKQTCHPHFSPPVRPLTRKLFKRWTLHFMYFRSKEWSWKKSMQVLTGKLWTVSRWWELPGVLTQPLQLWKGFHTLPQGCFLLLHLGCSTPRITWFSGSVWNSWTHPICSDTETSVVFVPGSVLVCILDKGKWQGLLQR